MSTSLEKINKSNGQFFTQDDINKIDSNSTVVQNALNNLDTSKANVIYESPIVPTLINSWVDYGTPYSTVGYWKDSFGIVHLKGAIKNGISSNSIVFTLPTGYRPNNSIGFAILGYGETIGGDGTSTCSVVISSEGNVTIGDLNNSYSTIICLDNISFRVGV